MEQPQPLTWASTAHSVPEEPPFLPPLLFRAGLAHLDVLEGKMLHPDGKNGRPYRRGWRGAGSGVRGGGTQVKRWFPLGCRLGLQGWQAVGCERPHQLYWDARHPSVPLPRVLQTRPGFSALCLLLQVCARSPSPRAVSECMHTATLTVPQNLISRPHTEALTLSPKTCPLGPTP